MFHGLTTTRRNQLLGMLTGEDFARLYPLLEHVELPVNSMLVSPDEPIEHAYFIEEGVASIIASSEAGQEIEVCTIGAEGMSGMSIVLGQDRTPHRTVVQVPGSAMRISKANLCAVLLAYPTIHALLLRYVQTVVVQLAASTLATGRFTIEQRLARWILMSRDRCDGDDVPITHEVVALMLGVRRSSVTNALHVLEGEGAIRSTRGHIVVRDRAMLEGIARDSYGTPEEEYERLVRGSRAAAVLQ